ALAANPDDAQAYLVLGECYRLLLEATRERAWARYMPELVQLRWAQATTALNRAVALNPRLATAHLRLHELYRQMGYLDLALNHLGTYLELARKARRAGAEPTPEEDRLQEELPRLAKGVESRNKEYAEAAPNLRVLDRALLASRAGLAGKARD